MEPKNYNRFVTKFIINPKFQFKMVLLFLLISVMNNVIFYTAVHLFFNQAQSGAASMGIPEAKPFYDFIMNQKNEMNFNLIIVLVLSTLLMFFIGITLSHKIAGPLYRLNLHFRNMANDSTLKKIHFRKGDFFNEIAVEESFNKFVDDYNKKG